MPSVNDTASNRNKNYKITGSASRLSGNLAILSTLPPGAFPRALTETDYFTQISVMEILHIPPINSDMMQIESIQAAVQIHSQVVIITPESPLNPVTSLPIPNLEGNTLTGRKLLIQGSLCQTITYTVDSCTTDVYSVEFYIPFSAFIVIPKMFTLSPTVTVDTLDIHFIVNSLTEDLYATLLTPRSLFTNTTLFLQAAPIIDNDPMEDPGGNYTIPYTTTGVCSPQTLSAMLQPTICNLEVNCWTQSIFSDIVILTPNHPAFESCMSVSGRVVILSQRVIETPFATTITTNQEGSHLTGKKLVIEGTIKQKVIYSAINCKQSTHSASFDLPFSIFIVIDSSNSLNTNFFIDTCIEHLTIEKIDERTLMMQTAVFFRALPNKIINYRAILEALPRYRPQFCCLAKNVVVEGLCNAQNTTLVADTDGLGAWKQVSVTHIVELPADKPQIESLQKIYITMNILSKKIITTPSGTNLYNMTITGNKLVVEALIMQKIFYSAATPSQPIHSLQTRQLFSAFIVLPATTAEEYCVDVCIEDVFAQPLDCRHIFNNVTIFLQARPYTALCRTLPDAKHDSAFDSFTLENKFILIG